MRDYLVLLLVLATVPLALYRPWLGLLGFSWLAYMRPQDLAWGMAADLPLSKWVAAAVWLSLILRGKLNPFRRSPITAALLVMWTWLLVSCLFAEHRDVALEKFQDITKVILVALLTVVVVTDRRRFRTVLAVIGLSLGFLGLKYGVYGVAAGGVHFTRGVGGMIGDNNDFALALNMGLPLVVYLSSDLGRRAWRLACFAVVPMIAITVVFTHSRGGFLSLAAVTLFLVAQSRHRFLAGSLVVGLALLASLVVPHSFYERIASIAAYQEDGSAMGRLNAWRAAIDMANDSPVVGVGLDNFLQVFPHYAPDPDDIHVAHNTWLQVLAEAGYIGLLLYAGLFAVTLWTLWRVRRRARRHGLLWASRGGTALAASIIAFIVGGTFLNRAHFDLIYHVMGLVVALDRITAFEITAGDTEDDAETDDRARGPDAEDAA
jgi:probable O-glycosylation ligase (exosortase A-associated)